MKDLLRLAIALTLITAGAGMILALVEDATREPIAEQRRLATVRALKAVLPEIDNQPDSDTATLVTGIDKRGRDVQRIFYRGRKGEALVGIAFKVTAPDGYSGNIDIMVGVRPDNTVVGIEILTHAETPGLGDKIELASFKDQFQTRTLENVDWRVKKDGGEFDQITGATISPRAVVKAVHAGLTYFSEHRNEVIGEQP